jgi:predicted CopG family antitoxin
MKSKITISIDDEVLKKAKKQMPNISEFLNECLKQYLGLADGIFPTADVNDIVKDIAKSQAKLFIINQNYDYEKAQKEIEDEKLNKALRGVWFEYSKTLLPEGDAFENALTVLNVDAETLEDMLDFADMNRDELGLNFTWSKLCEMYENEEVE